MSSRHYRAVLRAGSLLFIACLSNAAVRTDTASKAQVLDTYGKLPLTFEQNQGQTDSQVKFLARGSGYTLFLTPDSAILALQRERAASVLRMKLVGANRNPATAGTDALPGKSNYFVGNDPSKWRTDVPTYAKVKYRGVYPGIDLVYYGNQRLLEYDFLVAPGADPGAIELRFQGAKKLRVNDDGALVLDVGAGEVIEHAPAVYQEISGERRTVEGKYVLRGKGRVGFSVAEYDRTQPLVIDPTLVYSTFLGGSVSQSGQGIRVDASGNAYVVGWTNSADFPTTAGAFQTSKGTAGSAFVSKFNPDGSALVYSTFLGGTGGAGASGIAVDASGNSYVTGAAGADFPTTAGAFQTNYAGGDNDVFVTKLNTAGLLVYSTYLGGTGTDGAAGIAIDVSGNSYVTGGTNSPNFPTTAGAFQTSLPGSWQGSGFVTKLNSKGSQLLYSTYLGGSVADFPHGIVADASGNAYVTGSAGSTDFPTTPGAFQVKAAGNGDAFVTKLNPAGSALVYSTYLGGSGGGENAGAIAIDGSGNAYVGGDTHSPDFPVTPNSIPNLFGIYPWCYICGKGFVSKLNAAGSGLVYSTYLSGYGGGSSVSGIAVDAAGHAYVAGASSNERDFPTTPEAIKTSDWCGGFVSKLNKAGSALAYSSYLGGSACDWASAISLDSSGNIYVTGGTLSPDFPTTPGTFQTTGGGYDSFVSKLSLGSFVAPPVTTAAVSGTVGNDGWYIAAPTVTLSTTDEDSTVAHTYYIDYSGYYVFQTYVGPFVLPGDGIHSLIFYSVDVAGRAEPVHGQSVKIDATKPVSHVTALPATESTFTFPVSWTGTDATSGVRDFSVYVSDNSGPFTAWLTHTTATQASFVGTFQHSYSFFSTARDAAGNEELLKATADASTKVQPTISGDVNGDGKIDCTDVAIVKASLGKRSGQTGFDARADLNRDGIVDVRDLAIVAQQLPNGTKCP
jgi:hypothetical protein